ncbi:MAG TPA: trigger factor [Terriglobales bacterium]|jgi:trigger factor
MTESSECTRNLEIEIPAGEVEREYTRIAQGFQKRARIHGFRPGKAPLSLVRQHFAAKIREETLETLVPAHLRAAFERESLEPVSTPALEGLNYQPGAPVTFKASFEVVPPFELGDYHSIAVAQSPVVVTDVEVNDTLEGLRQRHSKREDTDATEAADGLVAWTEASRLPDTPDTAEAGTAAPVPPSPTPDPPQELPIEVGSAETLPEFNVALRGMKIGEERDLEVTYPGDYPNPDLAGKTQKYRLKLNRIQSKTVPELTDAFVKEATGAETVAELRDRIRANFKAEREHEARHKAQDEVVDQLLKLTPFPVPHALVEKQIDAKLRRNLNELADRGIDPRKLKIDWSQLREKHREAAEREVRAALLLDKIAEREHLEAPEEAVTAEIARAAAELQQTPEALRARLTEDGSLDRIKNSLRQDHVLKFLLDRSPGPQNSSEVNS